jgi:precorrin-6B methylase 2
MHAMRNQVADMEAKIRSCKSAAAAELAAAKSNTAVAVAEMHKAQKVCQEACDQHKVETAQLRKQIAAAARERDALVLALAAASAEVMGGKGADEQSIAEVCSTRFTHDKLHITEHAPPATALACCRMPQMQGLQGTSPASDQCPLG